MADAYKLDSTVWDNRIVGHDMVAAEELLAHPDNFRIHGKLQQDVTAGSLNDLGWVKSVVVNVNTGRIVDGHLRVTLAMRKGEDTQVPVEYVDLSESEEAQALTSLDYIATLAGQDAEKLETLMHEIQTDDSDLQQMFADMASEAGLTFGDGVAELDGAVVENKGSLAEAFLLPPFSIFDTRQGYWQDRKQGWLSLGIKGEVGRSAKAFNTQEWVKKSDISGNSAFLTGVSVFDPVLCEISYSWFSGAGASVLDPFAGGSVRGIVASRLGRRYTGIELRAEQVTANKEQMSIANPALPPEWLCGDSAKMAGVLEEDAMFDLLFSCPPYADLEVYSDDPADISNMSYCDFLPAYRNIIKLSIDRLKDDSFAVFVVGEVRGKGGEYYNFVGDTVKAFVDAGCKYYNEAILINTAGSLPIRVSQQFVPSRKLGKCHQNILVFVKGDPKRATSRCGKVEIADPAEMFGDVE